MAAGVTHRGWSRSTQRIGFTVVVGLASACGCGSRSTAPALPPSQRLDTDRIAALIPPAAARDRRSWASAIAAALTVTNQPVDREHACSVIAIIGQESGFEADPRVPGLAAVVQKRLEAEQSRLGPLGEPVMNRLLDGHFGSDPRPFRERMASVRTERDLDRVFRDLLAFYETQHRWLYGAANLAGRVWKGTSLEDLNPITTAGPMQVSVRFAERWARDHEGSEAAERVRDSLYTVDGGVRYGTARLYAHPASYDRPVYRFADYNAGLYASRNAALQAQLARMTGVPLALDGDFLAYDSAGEVRDDETETMRALFLFRDRYATTISQDRLAKDVRLEKREEFETTDTYRTIRSVYARRHGNAAYAQIPQVDIRSPKLRGTRSTAWFARAVDRRFEACLAGHI